MTNNKNIKIKKITQKILTNFGIILKLALKSNFRNIQLK